MASLFCLFSVALCNLNSQNSQGVENRAGFSDIKNEMPLASQFVTVPRVYTSPCPKFFRYTFNGQQWFGLIAMPSVPTGRMLQLRVLLTIGFDLNSVSL